MGYSFFDSGWHHPEASGADNRYEPGETVQESGSEKSQAPVTHAIDSGRMTSNPYLTDKGRVADHTGIARTQSAPDVLMLYAGQEV